MKMQLQFKQFLLIFYRSEDVHEQVFSIVFCAEHI